MALYSFITNKDIDVSLKQYFFDQVTADAPHVIKTAEGAAFSLIKSMLNNRYDLVKLFPVITEYDNTKAYAKDDYISNLDIIYKAKQASTANDPAATNSAYWDESDPRDKLLILHCVNITVFFLLERINQRKVSQDVIDAYNRAINWLEDVKREHENPDFPLIEIGGMEVRSGSNKQIDHYW